MRFKAGWILSAALFIGSVHPALHTQEEASPSVTHFTPFTGRIIRNKVRLRTHPSLDGQILRELSRNDLLVVKGEEDEFYAVQPPKDVKAYIYRTYVLDGIVEGNRVNVRLEPDTEAPVIAQVGAGTKVDGIISPLNSKWLEITPPAAAQFYVCKEYVENVGDANLISKMEERREEVNTQITSMAHASQAELQKPYEHIRLAHINQNLQNIIEEYSDFPDQSAKAKAMLVNIQEEYTAKKIRYLEAKAGLSEGQHTLKKPLTPDDAQPLAQPVYADVKIEKVQLNSDEKLTPTAEKTLPSHPPIQWNAALDPQAKTDRMAAWIPVEKGLYDAWAATKANPSLESYYADQYEDSVAVRGLVEAYYRPINNKPGDYILINKGTNLPIAYLYSTVIDLQEHLGKEITLRTAPRPNNQFAFPAYYVLAIE